MTHLQMAGGRPSRRVAVLGIAALALMLSAAPVAAAPWTHPTRVFAARFEPAHSMVIDGAGAIHIAAEGGAAQGIWSITNAGGTWASVQVTHGDDRQPSLALDPDGHAVIAFARHDRQTGTPRGIWVASDATGSWVVSRVHAGRDRDPSAAVRDDSSVKIAFVSRHRLLYYGHPGGPTVIDPSCCAGPPALALTTTGSVRVAYPDGNPSSPTGLRLAKRTNEMWGSVLVDGHAVRHVAMALDDIGGATSTHLAYDRPSGTYAAIIGGGFRTTWRLGGERGQPDIALCCEGRVVIVTATPAGNVRLYDLFGDSADQRLLTTSQMDSAPEVAIFGMRARVLFDRSSGTTNDGLFLIREQ